MAAQINLSSLQFSAEYNKWMGIFNACWSAMDLSTDLVICKFLGVTYLQAHLITSGMMFGRKARLLADLVGRSSHPDRDKILGTFNKIRSEAHRDVFAHSYVLADSQSIIFIDRPGGGEARAKQYTYSLDEFIAHVKKFMDLGAEFENAVRNVYSDSERNTFAKAALGLNRKSAASSQNDT